MDENIIKVMHATKSFGEETVLQDVTVDFEKGKIHGIIGRNGSGKTMLFKCICGLISLSSGEIIVDGKKIGKDTDVPEQVGMIIEAPGFLPNYSGYGNLRLLASIHNKIKKEAIFAAMEKVGLKPESKKHVRKYSLGMKQRLGIAQAIMENPRILIFDEPFNGLDNQGVEDMRKLFLELKEEGKTILIASHNAEDIKILCDYVYSMEAGKLAFHEKTNKTTKKNQKDILKKS